MEAPWDFLASLFCGVIGYEIALLLRGQNWVSDWGADGRWSAIPFVSPSTLVAPHTQFSSLYPKPPLFPFPFRKRILCGQRKRDGRTMMMRRRYQTSKSPFNCWWQIWVGTFGLLMSMKLGSSRNDLEGALHWDSDGCCFVDWPKAVWCEDIYIKTEAELHDHATRPDCGGIHAT